MPEARKLLPYMVYFLELGECFPMAAYTAEEAATYLVACVEPDIKRGWYVNKGIDPEFPIDQLTIKISLIDGFEVSSSIKEPVGPGGRSLTRKAGQWPTNGLSVQFMQGK